MKRDSKLYLKDIIDSISSINEFIKGYDKSSFCDDDKTVSAVIRKLEIIGEAVKNLPNEILINNPDLPWSSMAKMRDRLVHGYFDTDPFIIWETITEDLKGLSEKIIKIFNDL